MGGENCIERSFHPALIGLARPAKKISNSGRPRAFQAGERQPDGQRVFFSRFENLDWTIVAYDLTTATETGLGKGRWPDLSKDGRVLLFSAAESGVDTLYLSLFDQSQRVLLVPDGDAQTNPLWRP